MTLTMERPVVETPVNGSFRAWKRGALTVVAAPREIDISNSRRLRDELLVAIMRGTTVVVDMSRTAFCDSTALGVIAAASRELNASGGELRVVSTNRVTLCCMRATGDDRRFRVFPSLHEALSAGDRPGAAEHQRLRHLTALRSAQRRG